MADQKAGSRVDYLAESWVASKVVRLVACSVVWTADQTVVSSAENLAGMMAGPRAAPLAASTAETTADHLVGWSAGQKAAYLAAYWAGKLVAW